MLFIELSISILVKEAVFFYSFEVNFWPVLVLYVVGTCCCCFVEKERRRPRAIKSLRRRQFVQGDFRVSLPTRRERRDREKRREGKFFFLLLLFYPRVSCRIAVGNGDKRGKGEGRRNKEDGWRKVSISFSLEEEGKSEAKAAMSCAAEKGK